MTYPMLLSLPVPTTPISAFFALFMAVPLLPTHPPTFIYCMPLFSHSSYLLHDPSHSPTPAWPLPPHFRFFCIFYGCPPPTNTFSHSFALFFYSSSLHSFLHYLLLPSFTPLP